MKNLPVWFERLENLAIAAAIVAFFVHLHFDWWWLLVLFVVFDISMVGYLVNKRIGAITYNLVHNYFVPAVLLLIYTFTATRGYAFVGLVWAFHVAGDRTQGYGLKFSTSFQDTHLGKIGKKPE
jgi:hypothetical protein